MFHHHKLLQLQPKDLIAVPFQKLKNDWGQNLDRCHEVKIDLLCFLLVDFLGQLTSSLKLAGICAAGPSS